MITMVLMAAITGRGPSKPERPFAQMALTLARFLDFQVTTSVSTPRVNSSLAVVARLWVRAKTVPQSLGLGTLAVTEDTALVR